MAATLNEAVVSATCELFIRKLDMVIERKADPKTGINLMVFLMEGLNILPMGRSTSRPSPPWSGSASPPLGARDPSGPAGAAIVGVFAACLDGEVVGFTWGWSGCWTRGYIDNVPVFPAHRRKGWHPLCWAP